MNPDSTCPACAEELSEKGAERCPWCGERFEREEVPSDGFGNDSLLVALICVAGTVALMGWALFG